MPMVGKGGGLPVRPQEPLESLRLKVLFHPPERPHAVSPAYLCHAPTLNTHREKQDRCREHMAQTVGQGQDPGLLLTLHLATRRQEAF